MKQKLHFLLPIMVLFNLHTVFSQVTEDFEDETVGTTQFTVDGNTYTLTGDFLINEFANFSCSGTNTGNNKYIDSGYLDGASSGIIGNIIAPNNITFRVSTTLSQCGWVGANDGDALTTGTIRIIGTKTDNTTIQEDFTLTSDNFTTLNSFTFSSAIWNSVDLKQLSFEIVNGMDYFAIDNLVFESSTLSINDFDFYSEKEVYLFPNPTSSYIELTGLKTQKNFKIYDFLGKVIKSGTVYNQEKIDIKEFTSGLYFLKLENGNTIKFIKE
jgi:hypothetical protein